MIINPASSSYQNQVSGPFKDDFFLSNLRIGGGRGSRFNGYFPRESYYNRRPKRPWFPYPEYATSNEIYSNKRPSSDEIPKSVEYGSTENGYGSKGSSEEYPASPEYGANEVFSDERKPTEGPAQPDNSAENQVVDTRRSTKIIFSYDDNDEFGPHNWSKISKNCSGNSQSPVNLYTENSRYDDYSQPLLIEGFNSLASSIRIENSGHSALIRLSYPNGKPARIMGGPLKVPYILDNIHWHWGREDTSGSEHTVNARRYSAEAHFVTYNSNYGEREAFKATKSSFCLFQSPWQKHQQLQRALLSLQSFTRLVLSFLPLLALRQFHVNVGPFYSSITQRTTLSFD